MRFGVSYNLFNGEEHFLHSLRSVRSSLDHINVVVQYVSNFGDQAAENLFQVVGEAKRSGLVDQVIEYSPDFSVTAQSNELLKRNIGLEAAKSAGIGYFFTMDADEYYDSDQLSEAKRFILTNGIDTTCAHSYLHIKRPIYRSRLPDTTCVCFFTRIDNSTRLTLNDHFPALVDPTRRINGNRSRYYMFGADEISMKHMNLVRQDGLRSKLRNTSSAHMTEFISRVKSVYDSWTFGDVLMFPYKDPMEIIEVPDVFGIDYLFSSH